MALVSMGRPAVGGHLRCHHITSGGIMKELQRIGIIGGTFNPIHLGHLMIAEMAREAYNLEKVIFVPAYHPPHKHEDVIDAKYRYEMTEAAVSDNPYFTVSDVEFKREGPSYTIDTVRHFIKEYGPDTEFYFIAGTDSIRDLPNWKYIDDLLPLCHFIGAVRPDGSAAIDDVVAYFGELGAQRIHRLDVPIMRLSATDLRRRLRERRTVRYLISKAVVEYIKDHDIYKK